MRTWEGRCHDINIKAFTWRFVLDESKLRNFQYSLEHCNGRCPRDVFIHIPLLIWLIASSDKSYICIGKRVSISAWASTLLVQSKRATLKAPTPM